MSETFSLSNGKVLFTFLTGPRGVQQVEITIGREQRRIELWEFNKDMLPISEEAAKRSSR